MALCGVVVGMCLLTLSLAFLHDTPFVGGQNITVRQAARLATTSASGAASGTTANTNTTTSAQTETGTTSANTTHLAGRLFAESPFRFIKILNDAPGGAYTYFVATDRSKLATDGSPIANDEACGGAHTQPTCYLFRESNYLPGTEHQPALLSTWQGPGAFGTNTAVTYSKQGADTVLQFTTTDSANGGCWVHTQHRIDLTTGVHTLGKTVHGCGK